MYRKSKHASIVLVEDNPDDATLMQVSLADLKHPTVVLSDGQMALDYLFSQGAYESEPVREQPLLVLLDLSLPKIDGFKVLEAIRRNEETHRLPVVIFTASDNEADRLACYRLGANSYVCKPANWKDFREVVATIGLYWTQLSQHPTDP